MFLSGVLFVLFLAGCLGAIAWVITRKSRRARRWPPIWAGHPALADHDSTNVRWYPQRPATADASLADAALARHPASQSRKPGRPRGIVPRGPDDDPEFLRQLAERIRGEQ
jgi:hypothetical protein